MPKKTGSILPESKSDSKLFHQFRSPLFLGVGILIILAIVAAVLLGTGNLSGFFALNQSNPSVDSPNAQDPSQYLSRETYFQKAFMPDRSNYHLFEAASQFTKKPLTEMPAYFSLREESEIFEQLPPVPKDFSEISYFLASGKFFDIARLDEGYFKQPEFYPGFKESGLRYWKQPDPTSWGTNGYGTYPAEQWATLKTGSTENFESTVFLYTSFGVQTFQGLTVVPTGDALQYFDVTVSPQTIVLEPSFPKFHSEWAKKITVRGSLKSGTPKGDYVISLVIGFPPADKRTEWQLQYRNLYMDAAAGVKPSGNPIDLHIKVE